MSSVHVGLSGHSYREWQREGGFYPPKLRQAAYLRHYAGRYDALEAVGTFAHVPTEKTVAKWIAETPDGFSVCPKMHQRTTHLQRLKPESQETVTALVEPLLPLKTAERLGPILLQLPPNLKRNDHLLDTFLASLPPLRWAVEFRHESWNVAETEALLRAHRVAWVAADTDDADAPLRDTADFHYVRLRKTAYEDEALDLWAEHLLASSKPAFVFCRHTDVEAPWLWADRIIAALRS